MQHHRVGGPGTRLPGRAPGPSRPAQNPPPARAGMEGGFTHYPDLWPVLSRGPGGWGQARCGYRRPGRPRTQYISRVRAWPCPQGRAGAVVRRGQARVDPTRGTAAHPRGAAAAGKPSRPGGPARSADAASAGERSLSAWTEPGTCRQARRRGPATPRSGESECWPGGKPRPGRCPRAGRTTSQRRHHRPVNPSNRA